MYFIRNCVESQYLLVLRHLEKEQYIKYFIDLLNNGGFV